jgi:AraC family transcriptional regulator
MDLNQRKLGAWQGLTLLLQTGPSERGAHSHSSHMLSLQLNGIVQANWNGRPSSGSAILAPGALTLLPAGSQHAKCAVRVHGSSGQLTQLVAFVSPARFNTLPRMRSELNEIRGFRDTQLERLLLALSDAAVHRTPATELFGEYIAKAIAVHLITTHAKAGNVIPNYRGGIARSRLTRVLERLDANLQFPVPISELAETSGLSLSHFSRAFRQSTGLSPHQYLLTRRIERAKSLLSDPNLSVAEIAVNVGFAQQNHFARVFRKHTGLSPNEFRRQLSHPGRG